ncbi:MAG: PilT/PilU family type 4a pilus ATPase [Betaproteobacteria bacterium]|jgi:twitching motility protein PilU|nr:MAG: PilT/PilU family type 4a pilus ATPase [Betaproteobacteria bacterium]
MFIDPLLRLMAEKDASDLFISAGAPISIKILDTIVPVNQTVVDGNLTQKIASELMDQKQAAIFEQEWEMNFSHVLDGVGRFRINVFRQRGNVGLVVRYRRGGTPGIDKLGLPALLTELVMEKRGFVLVVGSTGSGKSTTLAAMIEHRNAHKAGHILTIEDPMEFVFNSDKCLVNQREIGTDTHSYEHALVNAMREAPDMMMIGEIRDKETLQHALLYAQTGHLCLSTLHANNSYHALNRIVNFFPHDARPALLADLSMSLRAIVSQRLVKGNDGTLVAAVEVMMNTKLVSEHIRKGEIDEVRDAMTQSLTPGSKTFEQALLELYQQGRISKDEAMKNADSSTNMAWLINNYEQKASGKLGESPTGRLVVKPGGDYSFSEIKLNVGDKG